MILWMLIHSDCLPHWLLMGAGFNCSRRDLGVMEKMVTQLRNGRRGVLGAWGLHPQVLRLNGNVSVRTQL